MRQVFTMIPKAILDKRLSIEAIGLYTWLSANADKKGRVTTSRADLSKRTGLSQRQVRTAIEKLEATKLVTKQATKGTTKVATILTVLFLADYETKQKSTDQSCDQSCGQTSDQPRAYKNDILFNHSIEEDKEEKRNNLSVDKFKEKFGKYDFSFVSDDMAETFFRWLSYRKELKKPFSTQSSLMQNYNKLMKLAGNSPEKARLIVEQSIANQWQGLFNLVEEKDNYSVGQILHDNSAEKYLNDKSWK